MTDQSQPDRLAEIRARSAKRTQSQWLLDVSKAFASSIRVVDSRSGITSRVLCHFHRRWPNDRQDQFDATFVAYAPADIGWLIAEVERLRAENAELRRTEVIYGYFADDNQTFTELKNKALREAPQDEPGIHAYMRRLFKLDDEPSQEDNDFVFPEPQRHTVSGVIVGSRVRSELPDITDEAAE